jgi:group I intron endonuclease
MIGIYKITNPIGKIYIGQSKDIHSRWKKNYYNLNCKEQIKLYNSLKKHDPKNHIFEIVEECSSEQLNGKEIYWGTFYQVLNPKIGLNLRLGDGNGSWGQEIKDKISKARLGMKFTDEHCINISKSKIGYVYSEDRDIKIGNSQKGIPKPNTRKSVLQYDLQGNFIKEWNSMSEALLFVNNGIGDSIGACCRNKQKTAYGFKWKYK